MASSSPKATPMLDVPTSAEKSYADGKILQSSTDGVGVITFNNAEKRNAMSLDMWEGLGSALVELRDDPAIRVVVLASGRGGGGWVGWGGDILFGSKDSQFGIPAAKLGIAYGYDGLKHLVSLVGPSWARLIMYTGMRIESAEALRIGLVDRVVPDGELWDATMEIARTISGNAPLAIKAAKITIAQVLKDESQRDMDAIKKIGTDCMDSEDFREGRH